jgi:hypothetical protein
MEIDLSSDESKGVNHPTQFPLHGTLKDTVKQHSDEELT